ncbi:MAG: Veg family protein [Clostridia bacterium]|nr:Veg family protein [Clostridia bacterium]
MREQCMDLEIIKKQIMELKGRDIEMAVNHGRKKIAHYQGVIEDIYNSVFVVRLQNDTKTEKMSCSFSDVLCGDVKIATKK